MSLRCPRCLPRPAQGKDGSRGICIVGSVKVPELTGSESSVRNNALHLGAHIGSCALRSLVELEPLEPCGSGVHDHEKG